MQGEGKKTMQTKMYNTHIIINKEKQGKTIFTSERYQKLVMCVINGGYFAFELFLSFFF